MHGLFTPIGGCVELSDDGLRVVACGLTSGHATRRGVELKGGYKYVAQNNPEHIAFVMGERARRAVIATNNLGSAGRDGR